MFQKQVKFSASQLAAVAPPLTTLTAMAANGFMSITS